MKNKQELRDILTLFANSGWDVIDGPARAWLAAWGENGAEDTETLMKAIETADRECGSCGCEFDPLYKRALALLQTA